MKIIADDKIPFLPGVLEPTAEVRYLPGKQITPDDVKDADALIIRTRTKCNAELLKGSSVKFIATATIGFDHIDTVWCEANGIRWTNAPGCNSSSVKQYITAALLHLAVRHDFSLEDMTLGVIGAGNVGNKVASAAKALGMKVLLNDPPRAREEGTGEFTELGELLATASIVTTHVPLNMDGEDKTFHLAGKEFFDKMQSGAIFINSSRGEVHDTPALKDALKSGKLSSAVLDVWENEPEIDLELLKLVDFGTPHIAGYSTDGKANGTSMSVQAVSRHFGLGLDSWYPEKVPPPENPHIDLKQFVEEAGKDASREKILKKAVARTYPICRDSRNLAEGPENFEKLRGDYPLRREFQAYRLENIAGLTNFACILSSLGFQI